MVPSIRSTLAVALTGVFLAGCGGSDSSSDALTSTFVTRYDGPFGAVEATDAGQVTASVEVESSTAPLITSGAAALDASEEPVAWASFESESAKAFRLTASPERNNSPIEAKKRNTQLSPTPTMLSIAPLTDAEKRALQDENNKNVNEGSRSFRTGIGRRVTSVDASGAKSAGQNLNWRTLPSGWRVAALGVDAGNAKAVRLGVHVASLPTGAVLRFYADGAGTQIEYKGNSVMQRIRASQSSGMNAEQAALVWGPVTDGARSVMEVAVPPTARLGEVDVLIAQATPMAFTSSEVIQKSQSKAWGDAGECNVDAVCQIDVNPDQAQAANAVMQLYYTVYDAFGVGSPRTCTGTILGDTAQSGQLFALTANHCINNQVKAGTVFGQARYRSESCNSDIQEDSYAYFWTSYLFSERRSTGSDASLLKLEGGLPPSGVTVAGWNAATVTSTTPVASFHHPSGDGLKYSAGSTRPLNTNYLRTLWGTGVTEPGSSGSALFNVNNQVIGTLWGGSSSCANPRGADEHGRFSAPYARGMRDWLLFPRNTLFAAADVDASGTKQLVWRHRRADGYGSRSVAVSAHDGLAQVSGWNPGGHEYDLTYALRTDAGRKLMGVFDLNGDGRDEFVFRRTTIQGDVLEAVYRYTYTYEIEDEFGNPQVVEVTYWAEQQVWRNLNSRVRLVGLADMDGDGTADLVLHDPTGNRLQVIRLSSDSVSGYYYQDAILPTMSLPAGWTPRTVGDFRGDSQAEVMLRNPNVPRRVKFLNWFSDATTLVETEGSMITFPGRLMGMADLNGDGKLDFAFNDAGVLRYAFSQLASPSSPNTADFRVSAPVVAGRRPTDSSLSVLADIDGDGRADMVWRNTKTGATRVGRSVTVPVTWQALRLVN